MNQDESQREIPPQSPISWNIAFSISWSGLRRRFLRSLITMFGVILAIAFLAYMLITDSITTALVAANNEQLNTKLQEAGVDIFAADESNEMMLLLIGLSLLICLVGIINSMMMAVTERVREIGTLKCLGALDTFIVKTFFIESSLQGVIGTVMGMAVGLLIAVAITLVNFTGQAMTYIPVVDIVKALAVTFVIGTLISITASIGPAYLAARKQPVEAMRVEQ